MAEHTSVQVLYQLCWEGKLEHPHMITVQYASDQDGLRLRDVKRCLTALRGQGIGHSFSWSYKRNYKNTFIWNDLSDDDVIHPLRGSREYVLKASGLIEAFTRDKAGEKRIEYQNERVQQSSLSSTHVSNQDSRAMPVAKLHAAGAAGTKDDTTNQRPPLCEEQETIDVEKSDFCSSSSDNEISPRPASTKPPDCSISTALVVMPTQSLPTSTSLPAEAPFSPGSAKRLWKREIRRSLFHKNTTAPAQLETSPSKDKETEASTPQLIRLIWNRWTGSTRRKRTSPEKPPSPQTKPNPPPTQPCEETPSSPPQVDTKESPAPARPPAPPETELHAPETPADAAMKPEQETELERPATVPSPVTEVKTPKPAIARAEIHSVKSCKGLPRVKTSVSPMPLPAGAHKGTNDTKPALRSSIPLASPPLRRSLSKPERRPSLVEDPAPSKAMKKLMSSRERDERRVTTLDWEKALQEAAVDCLPPPNFGKILKKCSSCGRTFKPGSLQVHMRGCHPPEYARAFSLRASQHMLRSRAP